MDDHLPFTLLPNYSPLLEEFTMIVAYIATFIALSITGAVFYSPVMAGNLFFSLAGFSSQHPYVHLLCPPTAA